MAEGEGYKHFAPPEQEQARSAPEEHDVYSFGIKKE